MGRQNLWIFCGWLSAPRLAWLVHRHHGSRRFRVSRVGSSVPASVCEYAPGTRTEQRWRVRPSTPACASSTVRTCGVTCDYYSTAALITAFASLELAASTRPAAPITLVALERRNEGVGDGQRQPVPRGLYVRAA